MKSVWWKYIAMFSVVALVAYALALACGPGEEPASNNDNNTTNNSTNNATNNATNNTTNNATNNGVTRVPGRYRISLGSAMTKDGPWEFSAEGEGVASFEVTGLTGIARYGLIEDLSESNTSRVDAIAVVKPDGMISYVGYPIESIPADASAIFGPPDSNCLLPAPSLSTQKVFDMGGASAGGYALVELFDYAANGDTVIVFEVGTCVSNPIVDPAGDFITETSTTSATLNLEYADIKTWRVFQRNWTASETQILNDTVYACATQPYFGQIFCESSAVPLGPNMMLFTMSLQNFIQSGDQNHDLRYGFAAAYTVNPGKEAETDWDLYQGASYWFEFSWNRSVWTYAAKRFDVNQVIDFDLARTRVIAAGDHVTFITSTDDLGGSSGVRMVTMAADGADRGGDVTGANPTEPYSSF